MSNSRKNFQLKDIVNIQSSTRIFEKEYVEEGIPFYRSKEIIEKQKGNDVSTNLYISQERFNKIKQAYSVPRQGDILLTSVGTIGIPYMVRENEQFYFKDGNLTWFNNFSKEIDNKYFYYWILSEVGKEALNSILIGTTQKALTIKDLKSLEISLPPLSEQKRISSILSSFDNKIEQLKKQNNILEDIAQSIFKEWFVKYNFPNKDGKPYKDNNGKMIDSELGLIPEGWRVGKLGEIVKCFDSKRIPLSKEEREQRKGKYPYYGATEIMDYVNEYLFDGKYLLLAEDGSVQTNQGYPVLQLVDGKFWVNNHTHVLQGKEPFSTEYIYLLMKKFNITNIVTGAVQPKINKTNLLSLELLLPDRKLVQNFNKTNTFLFEKIFENSYNITNLTKTKTALLNKLLQ